MNAAKAPMMPIRALMTRPRGTMRYRVALARIRFLAAASKVHRATPLQQAGQLDEASCCCLKKPSGSTRPVPSHHSKRQILAT